jgi:hypothetical protein
MGLSTGSTAVFRAPSGHGKGPSWYAQVPSTQGSRCPVPGCDTQIDASRLMCRDHWYLVPKEIRDLVWATWRSGTANLSREHQDAVLWALASSLTHPKNISATIFGRNGRGQTKPACRMAR